MSTKSEKQESSKVDVSQFTAMSIAEARSTIWPFKGIRKPIGILLESGEITIRDLAWASENAYDLHVKQAAKTILISRLFPEKFTEPLKPAKAITGGGYTAFQRRRAIEFNSLAWGVFWGISLIVVMVYILVQFEKTYSIYVDQYKLVIDNVAGITFFIVIPFVMVWFANHYADVSEQYAIGEEAENQAVDSLRSLLNEPWTIIHNLEFPQRKWGDIDIVLVGIGGIWAIEVKGYTNQIRNIGDSWHFKNKFGWWKLSKHPAKQARRNAMRLKNYLDLEGINVGWVEAVVLWAGDENKLIVEKPETPVWKISELPTMQEFWKKQKLSNEQINQIIKILQNAIDARNKDRKK